MSPWRAAAIALIAGGCAGHEAPGTDTGTVAGDPGEPRNRARVHTELAA